MSELADLSIAEAARHLRRRKVSAQELTEACLARLSTWRPINAFLWIDAEGAMASAKASDRRRRRRHPRGPLDGIPVAHKDIFKRAGRIMTVGSIILDQPATETATVLRRLDRAGAIELGRLHTSEFAGGATGHNRHYGTCRNPWNVRRTPGGSSGGSAAALAAGLVFGSLGTDTGGSLRLPAHFCGVAALRPTYGRVSRSGVFPRSWTADAVGPMARTVEDLALLLDAIGGLDPGDATTAPITMRRNTARLERSVRGICIGVPRNFFYDKVEGDIAKLLNASLHGLQRLGARIVPVDVPDPQIAFELAQIVAKVEAAAIHEPWLPLRQRDYDHGIVEGMASGWHVLAIEYLRALRHRGIALQAWLDDVFTAVDVLHTPVYEHPTPALDACAPRNPHAVAAIMATFGRCTRPFSYLGLPSLAVPCGFQSDGMPAAFQLVGRPFDEALLLNVGHLYQQETGWHARRPAYPSAQNGKRAHRAG
jgi:aspartyl-tRNA(Asn)/glutamyl-tRNA(Gln) amidotransferase subunit A